MPPGYYNQTGSPAGGGNSGYYGGQGYGNQEAEDQALFREDQAQQRQREQAAARERNRTVTVTIKGAVIGPVDQNGAAWDGPGLSSDDISLFAGLVVKEFPVGEVPVLGDVVAGFAGELANTAFATFEPPDPKGTVTEVVAAYGSGGSSFDLPKKQDTYTPMWSVQIPRVLIHAATLRIDLWDADVAFDDPIAAIGIGEQILLAAEASGGTYAIDASSGTGGMLQRVFITVTPS